MKKLKEFANKVVHKIREQKKLVGAVMVLLASLAMSLLIYMIDIENGAESFHTTVYGTEYDNSNLSTGENPLLDNEYALPLKEGEKYTVTFVSKSDVINTIMLKFLSESYTGGTHLDGSVKISLSDENGIIHSEEVALSDIYWIHYRTMILPRELTSCQGKTFQVSVELLQENPQHPIYLEQATEGEILVKVGEHNYSFLKTAYWILVAVAIVGILVIYYMIVFKKSPAHHVYLAIAIMLGIIYCAAIPPLMTPDEPVHFEESYDVSNILLGDNDVEPGWQYRRLEDLNTVFRPYPTIDTYRDIYYDLLDGEVDATMGKALRASGNASEFHYLAAGLGITVGRVLGLNNILTFWLARWGNYILYMALVYWAIKKTPIGKNAIIVLTMLPMAMQQSMTVSYDCVANGVSLLLIATCLNMAMKREKIKWKEMILYCVLAAILASIKGGIYLPLCCLALIIPMKQFASKKKYWIGAGVVLAAIIVGWFGTNYQTFLGIFGFDNGIVYDPIAVGGGTNVIPYYSMGDFIHNPVMFVKMLAATILGNADFYVQSTIGGLLGWFSVAIPWWIVCGFLVVFLFSAIETNEKVLTVLQKSWLFVVFAGVVVLSMLVMAVMFTPNSSPVILGVQGRYFLPVLLFVPLIFKNRTIISKKNLFPQLITVTMCLQIFTWLYIIKSIV